MDRRDFIKTVGLGAASVLLSGNLSLLAIGGDNPTMTTSKRATVYFSREISPESLKHIYQLVSENITGKTAVKVHTGEPDAPYILSRDMVHEVMKAIPNATIVETNVFYDSPRNTTATHREVIEKNGWTFAPVDILDEDGDVNLPVVGGKWFKEIAMGKNLVAYDSMVVLTHFKGHLMGGFGGSLKNIAIGCASGKVGKKQLHQDGDDMWGFAQERLMENMVESGKAVTSFFGQRMAFVNVLNNLSVDCDCTGIHAAPPTAPDIGILASTDLLAVDQASVDMIYALPPSEREHLVERIESRKGLRQLEYMSEMGMGSKQYDLVHI